MMTKNIPATNHNNAAGPEEKVSGAAGTGQEKEELLWMQKHEKFSPAMRGQTNPIHTGRQERERK